MRFAWADWCMSVFYKFIFASFLSFLILSTQSVFAYETTAVVTDIQDGDTFSIIYHEEDTKVRLLDVDCFEVKKRKRARIQHELYHLSFDEILQKGKQSKHKLEELLGEHPTVHLKWNQRDGFGRLLAEVYLGDINVNQYMLEYGGCNKFVKTSKSKKNKK